MADMGHGTCMIRGYYEFFVCIQYYFEAFAAIKILFNSFLICKIRLLFEVNESYLYSLSLGKEKDQLGKPGEFYLIFDQKGGKFSLKTLTFFGRVV